jgi:alkaline phosphatase D
LINFGQLKTLWIILIVSAILLLNPSNLFKASAVPSFKYGVASGDVTSSSVILWAQTGEDATVKLEVTRSANFGGTPDFTSSALTTTAATDFTVKVLVPGLIANTQYYYRWKAGSLVSDVGSFKTAPSDTQLVDLHFSWSGDTDPSRIEPNLSPYFNDWSALQAARLEKPSPDFFIYLGDVIYSDMRAAGKPPPPLANASSLPEFRQLYKYARSVTALHDLLERTSIYPLWDDHEVRADWSGQTVDKILYGKGKQSFNEYMPIQDTSAPFDPVCAGPTQFRVRHWGANADIIILDTRSCRSDSSNVVRVCHKDLAPTLPPSIRATIPFLSLNPPPGCLDAIKDPVRTMLGTKQKAMFETALLNSKAKFKFVISSVNMQREKVISMLSQ